jgi:hypothetical protein
METEKEHLASQVTEKFICHGPVTVGRFSPIIIINCNISLNNPRERVSMLSLKAVTASFWLGPLAA